MVIFIPWELQSARNRQPKQTKKQRINNHGEKTHHGESAFSTVQLSATFLANLITHDLPTSVRTFIADLSHKNQGKPTCFFDDTKRSTRFLPRFCGPFSNAGLGVPGIMGYKL